MTCSLTDRGLMDWWVLTFVSDLALFNRLLTAGLFSRPILRKAEKFIGCRGTVDNIFASSPATPGLVLGVPDFFQIKN